MHNVLKLQTCKSTEFIEITDRVQETVSLSQVKNGICYIFVPHTTAAVTINENVDPDVVNDISTFLKLSIDDKCTYRHAEGNSPAHIKASLLGSSVIVFIEHGGLVLSAWQGIYFCEFDGPRARNYFVKIVPDFDA